MSIYLDHNATTPLDERALAAMIPYLKSCYANPSSIYREGRLARTAIDYAREQVADLVNVQPSQVIFTSGGTEANNLAIKGIVLGETQHLAVSAVEHDSVLQTADSLKSNLILDVIPVDDSGRVTEKAIDHTLKAKPSLLSVMMANNETGVIQDIAAISDRARQSSVVVHTDAAQAAGKIKVDFQALNVNLMTLSAHKLYGPKGIGALIIDKSLELSPLIHGGGHEMGYRSGTENVAGIVGFGMAAALAKNELDTRQTHLMELRNHLELQLQKISGVSVIAQNAPRLPNTTMIVVPGIEGETLLMQLDKENIAVSSGSACHSQSGQASHVLLAMGISPEIARCTLRISLGKDNSINDIDCFVSVLEKLLDQLVSSTWP
ncbi:MAG: cysteine desulfurase [Gammaproteobacteria bacterium]|nr:cysteine desulfurase [Gammaproteobacteria bacterium]